MEIQSAAPAQTAEATQTRQYWPIIGRAWFNKDGKSIAIRMGRLRNGVQLAESVTLKAGESLYLKVNSKREGKKDPDFQVLAIPVEAVAAAPAAAV